MNLDKYVRTDNQGGWLDYFDLAEDLDERPDVIAGYDSHMGFTVTKLIVGGVRQLWSVVRNSRLMWAVAELEDKHYRNHRYYEELSEALDEVLADG